MQEICRVTTAMSGLARKETVHCKQDHRAIPGAESRITRDAEKAHLPAGLGSRGMSKHFHGGGGIKVWGRAMGQTRLAGVCKSAHVLQPPLLQRKQKNHAAKTHPLQQPEPLAEEKTKHREIQILGVTSPGQGCPYE